MQRGRSRRDEGGHAGDADKRGHAGDVDEGGIADAIRATWLSATRQREGDADEGKGMR